MNYLKGKQAACALHTKPWIYCSTFHHDGSKLPSLPPGALFGVMPVSEQITLQ